MGRLTNKDRVLEYMQEFGSIDQHQAVADLGNYRLSASIYLLKQDGYEIETEIKTGKNRFGNPIHWAEYRLKGAE